VHWAFDRNPDYYSHFANDCTNFISQVLHAGGMWYMRNYEKGKGSWWSHDEGSITGPNIVSTDSWRLSEVLNHHLVEYHLVKPVSHPIPGDLVFYDFGDHAGEWDHIDVVTKGSGRSIAVTSHTKDKRNDDFYGSVVPRQKKEHGKLVPLHEHYDTADNELKGKRWTYEFYRPVHAGANIDE
jgi:hypothetical protein